MIAKAEVLVPPMPVEVEGTRYLKSVGNQGRRASYATYRCSCGERFGAWTGDVAGGKTRSCGCYKKASLSVTKKTHGVYSAYGERVAKWALCAPQRCTNKNALVYRHYGGRGVEFKFDSLMDYVKHMEVAAWIQGFGDIEDALDNGYSVDRVNNDGHYEHGNLRWASASEQLQNRRCSK